MTSRDPRIDRVTRTATPPRGRIPPWLEQDQEGLSVLQGWVPPPVHHQEPPALHGWRPPTLPQDMQALQNSLCVTQQPSTRSTATGSTPHDVAHATKQIFHAFATCSTGVVTLPNGGRSGRLAMGLQDFMRLAQAAQLRLPSADLEDSFMATVHRFGSGGNHFSKNDPTLAYELFVDLLREVAQRRYGDSASVGILFDDHLLPLSHRLRKLEGAAAARAAAAADNT